LRLSHYVVWKDWCCTINAWWITEQLKSGYLVVQRLDATLLTTSAYCTDRCCT
jgi:hypothetical protein